MFCVGALCGFVFRRLEMLSCFNPALLHPLFMVDRHEAEAVPFCSTPGKCMLRCLYCIFVIIISVSFDHIVF
jgi:hypothetical protein